MPKIKKGLITTETTWRSMKAPSSAAAKSKNCYVSSERRKHRNASVTTKLDLRVVTLFTCKEEQELGFFYLQKKSHGSVVLKY